MKRIYISFGGSHRKNARCANALRQFFSSPPMSKYQSKVMTAIAFDTPEMRETLKRMGGSICRKQPAWLNESNTL